MRETFRCADCRRRFLRPRGNSGFNGYCVQCGLAMTNQEYGLDQLVYEARR